MLPSIAMRRVSLDAYGTGHYTSNMDVETISHKGLRRFFETGSARGLVGDIERLRKMLAYIYAADDVAELAAPPNFGLHELSGNRKGTWSMTVTRNWRLTFRINADGALVDMNLEDYHGT
ncbi:type II toxin-antitoxin system RelE/ParE family toxin [Pelagibacterium luteolum]|uniref:Proteic killer suppression protein n=1 Tax=Pelagibacterium luteolum TaxID=440168 RepID=A0A1G8A683_9HYPH|nr:type II toxin-antitoxin system RelE/ParE family toxin [Pelagibacterium luteolum]SDH16462.1 proteic killer suppression protein [Pelagibacterium luteolum]